MSPPAEPGLYQFLIKNTSVGKKMTTFISFVIVLGVLIFIHELGHFLVA